MSSWLTPDSRRRRVLVGLAIYVACFAVYAILAGDRMQTHTAANHYALLADAWIHGRHHLAGTPPSYAGMNDFALFENKWFISFPPFPAVLMLPLVWAAGSPENFRDGQFVVWLAGIGPAVLFLVLEKLRRAGRSDRTEVDNVRLAALFAFGTVYFFTAVQGSVWYSAHVVGVGLAALYVLFALDADKPELAGAVLGCMFLTRPTTALTGVFFAIEAVRIAYPKPLPSEGSLGERLAEIAKNVDRAKLRSLVVRFAVPVVMALLFASWLNYTRFRDPSPAAFGHEYLQVGWKTRIDRWGLFDLHFLPRNLSVMWASMPWLSPKGTPPGGPAFVISGHGLALWFTTPFWLWLFRPKKMTFTFAAAGLAALGPCVMNLLYQNSGWFQFGYRFSNDYAVFLLVMLATTGRKLGRAFWACAAWAVLWNAFGAISFERDRFATYYSHDAAAPMRKWGGNATLDLVYPPD